MTAGPVLEVRGASRRYPLNRGADAVSLQLHRGRITCLLGASGSGKSTLLRLIAGLERVDDGEIVAGGRVLSSPSVHVSAERRRVGMVFQDLALFPHLTAIQNVAFGIKGLPHSDRLARARELMKQFRLDGREDDWPHRLSGGEQQRVAIARALAPDPVVILLDEPFSSLDGALRAEARDIVLSGLRALGAPALVVTHDPDEAMLMADELALMADGRILQTGSPEQVYSAPESPGAAVLLGPANMLRGRVRNGRILSVFGGGKSCSLPDGEAQVMIRPEGMQVGSDGAEAGAPVRVIDIRRVGPMFHVQIEAEGQTAEARQFQRPPAPGPAHVIVDPMQTHAWRLDGVSS